MQLETIISSTFSLLKLTSYASWCIYTRKVCTVVTFNVYSFGRLSVIKPSLNWNNEADSRARWIMYANLFCYSTGSNHSNFNFKPRLSIMEIKTLVLIQYLQKIRSWYSVKWNKLPNFENSISRKTKCSGLVSDVIKKLVYIKIIFPGGKVNGCFITLSVEWAKM